MAYYVQNIRTQKVTYLLTPWSRILLEKLTGSAASQEIPRIFGTRRFITVLTSARQLSLSWTNTIQSPQPPPTSRRSSLILSSHLRLGLPNGLFPSGFLTRTLCTPSHLPYTRHMQWGWQTLKSLNCKTALRLLDLWQFLSLVTVNTSRFFSNLPFYITP